MNFNYRFPAIRGIQAGEEYYISMIPLKFIKKIFGAQSESVPPQYRAQRLLNERRIPVIKQYIVENRDSYVFSALAASIDGKYEFINVSGDLGILEIDFDSIFLINDGQHRKAAIIDAIEEDPSLGDETISIVFYSDKGLVRSQQMFVDLNKNAVTTSRSLNTAFESKDPKALLAKKLVSEVEFFNLHTDMEKDILGDNSANLFTLTGFFNVVKIMTQGISLEADANLGDYIIKFWQNIDENMNVWTDFKNKEITKKSLRKDYIVVYGTYIQAIAKLGQWFYKNNVDYTQYTKNLYKIDWRRANMKDWRLRAVSEKGKISANQEAITLTYIRIKKLLGITLTDIELSKDENVNGVKQ